MRKFFFLFLSVLILSSSFSPLHASIIVPPTEIVPPGTEPDAGVTKSALDEFKSLSRKDRKERLKNVKKEWKAYTKAKKAGTEPSTNTVLLVILAILLPPLAVYLHEGVINGRFWLNLLLTLLFWLPGVIHALIIILGDK
jgi:uncharacterized membrane protein YqaE (UPF0057 family)